ncbi:MAG: hypothetical protein ACREJ3_09555 [Polyangiaceae bacterium]
MALAALAVAVQGCSSSPAHPTVDASVTSQDASIEAMAIEGEDAVGSEADGGAPASCDASLPVGGDAGVGACSRCKAMQCGAALAACGADCACAPIEICLEATNLDYPACPGAIGAISSGQQALKALADCTAIHCQVPCFAADAGGQ